MQNSIKDHAALSGIFNEDEPRVDWHDETLWFVREKRDKAVQSIPEWEQLREYGSQIKNHALSNLDQYLIEFEKKAKANGDRKSTRLNSSHANISYAVFCLKK